MSFPIEIKKKIFLFQNSHYGHGFIIILEILTHVNILVYVFISYYHSDQIYKSIKGCICVYKINEKFDRYFYLAVITLLVFWNIFCILHLREICREFLFVLVSLYFEKSIITWFEIQMCILLYFVKITMSQIKDEIIFEIKRREVSFIFL